MNHQPFLNIVKLTHDQTMIYYKSLARIYARVTGGDKMDGGNAGMTYERIFNHAANVLKIRHLFIKSGGVIDFSFEDYGALTQVKTKQGGPKALHYQFGKVVSHRRGDAAKEASDKIRNQFNLFDTANHLYLQSYNFANDTLDVYLLAEKLKSGNVRIINNFPFVSPNGFNPEARVGNELTFCTSTLERIYRYP